MPGVMVRDHSSTNLELVLASDLLNELAEDVGLDLELIKLGRSKATLVDDTLQTSKLLCGKPVVLAELVEDTDVVLGVFDLRLILQGLSGLLDLGSSLSEGSAASVFGNNLIESLDGTGNGVETTSGSAEGAGLAVEELNEGLLAATTLVVLGSSAALGEELDSGIRANVVLGGGGLAVLALGIDLGDQDVVLAGEVLGEGLPGGGKALAVYSRSAMSNWASPITFHLRPHHGAVKATRTFLSPPMAFLKVESVSMETWLTGAAFFLALTPVFSAMKLARESRSRPPL